MPKYSLPILNQPGYIKTALSAGKHVLSEKPIAPTIKDAEELIQWYHANIDTTKVTWGVAENFRYMNSFDYAHEQIQKLGRILNFRVRAYTLTSGGKYYGMHPSTILEPYLLLTASETEWRKVPGYQGGFVLDGGIHTIAGLRLLLSNDSVTRLSAFTNQIQKHLPPIDTVDATMKTKSGATGTVSISFGTTLSGSEWTFGCEKGSVSLAKGMRTKKPCLVSWRQSLKR